MAVKLTRRIALSGHLAGLEEDFKAQGLDEKNVLGRVFYLADCLNCNRLRLASGRYVTRDGLRDLSPENLNEVYRKLYAQRSRLKIESL